MGWVATNDCNKLKIFSIQSPYPFITSLLLFLTAFLTHSTLILLQNITIDIEKEWSIGLVSLCYVIFHVIYHCYAVDKYSILSIFYACKISIKYSLHVHKLKWKAVRSKIEVYNFCSILNPCERIILTHPSTKILTV